MTSDQASLFPELEVDPVEEARRRLEVSRQIDKMMGPGPVYQGVSKTIRRVTATGVYSDREQMIDPAQYAGVIAAARATARAVDKATGHNPSGWHANGRDVAPLLERLEQLLQILDPESDIDAFEAWMNDDSAPREEAARDRSPEAPHPPL